MLGEGRVGVVRSDLSGVSCRSSCRPEVRRGERRSPPPRALSRPEPSRFLLLRRPVVPPSGGADLRIHDIKR